MKKIKTGVFLTLSLVALDAAGEIVSDVITRQLCKWEVVREWDAISCPSIDAPAPKKLIEPEFPDDANQPSRRFSDYNIGIV